MWDDQWMWDDKNKMENIYIRPSTDEKINVNFIFVCFNTELTPGDA